MSSVDTYKIINDISRVLAAGGYLLCRVNSVNDVEFGAGQGEMLEVSYYKFEGRLKRFFDRKQIDTFFAGWDFEYVEECIMDRYPKLKRVWEIALMSALMKR